MEQVIEEMPNEIIAALEQMKERKGNKDVDSEELNKSVKHFMETGYFHVGNDWKNKKMEATK